MAVIMFIDLPPELSQLILKKLPMKSLLRLRCVCKLLRSLIDDPYFTKLHHSRSLTYPEISTRLLIYNVYDQNDIDFFSVEIGGDQQAVRCASFPQDYLVSVFYKQSDNVHYHTYYKSNGELDLKFYPGYEMTRDRIFPQVVKGLILLKDRIWNPLTGHLTTLPPAEEGLTECQPTDRFLGFDPHTNEYKVLYIRHCYQQEKEGYSTVCKILTITTDLGIIGSWRFIKTYPEEMRTIESPMLKGCGHDMLYLSHEDYYPRGVLALDLHTEVFDHTPSLPVDNISPGWYVYNNAFQGRSLFNDNDTFWLSDGKGGWDHKLLDILRPFKVLSPLGNGEILIYWYNKEDDNSVILAGYNLETGFIREIHIPNLQNFLFSHIKAHMECLIRL